MQGTPLWILALVVFVSVIITSNSAQVVAYGANSGAISIDCGLQQESRDEVNDFYYEADGSQFAESGEIHNVSSEYILTSKDEQIGQQLNTLRSFPKGQRNCYTLKPKQGKNNKYLIRAFFKYGNYDNKNSTPEFDLHLGVNYWTTISLQRSDYITRSEVIHVAPTDNIDVCLVNTGGGAPFISLLELWPLLNSLYQPMSSSLPLELISRPNLGMTEDFVFIRYIDDVYGRSWFNKTIDNSMPIMTSDAIESDSTAYKLPYEVLRTAIQSPNDNLLINWDYLEGYEYYVYLHFFDFVAHENQQRSMEIAFTDTIRENGVSPDNILITSLPSSRLPPMINAYEVYKVLPQPNSSTNEGDGKFNYYDCILNPETLPLLEMTVKAMQNIKHAYDIKRIDWQGDPCMPIDYRWEGLTCNSDSIPRVTSLNLSSGNLIGEINTSFSNLQKLESLDLSNNLLIGEIPSFLAELPNLKLLNLTGNNLTGSIPKALREKSGTTLTLSLDANPGLWLVDSCLKKTQKTIITLIASVVASVVVLVTAVCILVIFCKYKRKKRGDMEGHLVKYTSSGKDGKLKSKNRAFNHSEVVSMTNDFEIVIGQGGFGKVYLGKLQDDTQVAVKILSKSSQQGFKEFQSEAELLMIVHHRNLVSLTGYCDDGDVKALVYEYMNGGDLRHKLSDKNAYVLTWNERLHIALDASYGLDYLHNGCKPPIIHRDIKTSNILLSKNMQAKIADFGLSRAFFNDFDTHFSTRPAGTLGYLDPEFHSSGNLNKKSDVYSFGIILLELMTGRPAMIGMPGNTSHVADWVTPKLRSGDIQSIMDPRLEGKFNTASAWRFLEMAMSCVLPTAIQRPDISLVVAELRECLALEISLENAESNSGISSSALSISFSQSESDLAPYAR
ncbi:probable LRR receptor-like serine/threonine-protein kinase PAM74 [Prosopis cineraria]|uniref:probable LRR receptor-like serine/threonine-protein kinase PAM74 n=1 Tax=Prosopis cineraria TaxID=364024 RepID=UPI00240FEBA8|nr:probable LRR receptor-like serine/threonine-protein kinase PAM74 [Prosopis cineraria]